MSLRGMLVVACALIMGSAAAHENTHLMARGPLRILAENPRYFTDGNGKAILLAGSHTWNDLEDFAGQQPFDYDRYLRFMVSHRFNFMRLWTFWLPRGGLAALGDVQGPFPWARTGPGKARDGGPTFDLERLDPTYFDRLRTRVTKAGDAGVYVAVMLFDGYEFQFSTNPWSGNPFAGGNNVNGVDCAGTCPTDAAMISPAAWRYEEAYIRKVIDTVNDRDNVLYEVSNEAGSPYSDGWQARVIRYVRAYEAAKPLQHPIGMTFQYKGGIDKTLYLSDADWISPGARIPPLATGAKVVINDTDHSFYYTALQSAGPEGQRAWAWENFLRGSNLAFMDPYLIVWPKRNAPHDGAVDPAWDEIRNALADIRGFADKVDLAHMTPRSDLAGNAVSLLASPGAEYLAFDKSDRGAFKLTTEPGVYRYEWFDPAAHSIVQSGSVTVADSHVFAPPLNGDAVLWLHK